MQISPASSMQRSPAIDVGTVATQAAQITTSAAPDSLGVSGHMGKKTWIIEHGAIGAMNRNAVSTLQRLKGLAA